MMNWTRFFPTLLAAHRHRGAVCTAFSTTTTEPAAEPRAPALSPIVTSFVVAFLALAFFVPHVLADDQPGVIEGVVQSTETDAPLPGADVAVRRPSDSTLVGGASTDSTGHFVVENLPTGEYVVVASFTGYAASSRQRRPCPSPPRATSGPLARTNA